MSIGRLLSGAFICAIAFAQQQTVESPPLPLPAALSEVSISCRIDPSTRTATVTITNTADRPVLITRAGPAYDYEAELTSKSGERLPRHEDPPPKSGLRVRQASTAGLTLDPKQDHVEEVPLKFLVDIPKAGGTFHVRLGRAPVLKNPFHLDPEEILWCEPVNVTFPPLNSTQAQGEAGARTGYSQEQAPIAEISLTTGNAPQSVSGPISIRITLTNTSDAQIRVMETNPDKEYRLTLLDENGDQVPLTPYGEEMSNPQAIIERSFAKFLQPNEASGMPLDLHKFFDVKSPGKYKVSATRKIYKMDSNSGVEITSNVLPIELKR
jgi:hypothetical protein